MKRIYGPTLASLIFTLNASGQIQDLVQSHSDLSAHQSKIQTAFDTYARQCSVLNPLHCQLSAKAVPGTQSFTARQECFDEELWEQIGSKSNMIMTCGERTLLQVPIVVRKRLGYASKSHAGSIGFNNWEEMKGAMLTSKSSMAAAGQHAIEFLVSAPMLESKKILPLEFETFVKAEFGAEVKVTYSPTTGWRNNQGDILTLEANVQDDPNPIITAEYKIKNVFIDCGKKAYEPKPAGKVFTPTPQQPKNNRDFTY